MSQLELYTTAVASRRATNKEKNTVNYAVVSQLENDDIPRCLEIIRVQQKAIDYFLGHDEETELDVADALKSLRVLNERVEALAAEGSRNDWGPEPGNGHA